MTNSWLSYIPVYTVDHENTKLPYFYSSHRRGSIVQRLAVIVFKHWGLQGETKKTGIRLVDTVPFEQGSSESTSYPLKNE